MGLWNHFSDGWPSHEFIGTLSRSQFSRREAADSDSDEPWGSRVLDPWNDTEPRSGQVYAETEEAERWLRENDPSYRASSKAWTHIRRGNGVCRLRGRAIPMPPIGEDSEEQPFLPYYDVARAGDSPTSSVEEHVLEESADTQSLAPKVAGRQVMFDESALPGRIRSMSFPVRSDRKNVRRIRKVWKLQREEELLLTFLAGVWGGRQPSFRRLGRRWGFDDKAVKKALQMAIRRKYRTYLANRKGKETMLEPSLAESHAKHEGRIDSLEERVAELERYVGLVPGGSKMAAIEVERFIDFVLGEGEANAA